MGSRRSARELALQMLFQRGFHQDSQDSREGFVSFGQAQKTEVTAYAEQLVAGVLEHLTSIDGLIEKHAQHWSLERIAPVDRSILRFSICELLYFKEVPSKVVIDEAIEVAKKYGNEDSGAFINGILDQILRQSEASAPEVAS